MSIVEIRKEGKKIPIVNYLKGYSIITIAIMHLFFLMGNIPSFILKAVMIGGSGVHVFFFCSGLGLYYSYLYCESGYFEFLRKRFFKLYLPYITVVIITFLIQGKYYGNEKYIILLSHVFLFKMFIPAYDETFGAQLWFISTIIQFYFVFIPMCVLKKRLKDSRLFIAIFLILSILWWTFCYILGLAQIRVFNSFFLQYIWEFSLGFVIAENIFNGKEYKLPVQNLVITTILGLGLQVLMTLQNGNLKIYNDVPAFIGYISLALLLSKCKIIYEIAQKVSFYSYELFLVHVLIYSIIFHLVRSSGYVIRFSCGAFAFCLSLIVGYYYKKLYVFVSNKVGSKVLWSQK